MQGCRELIAKKLVGPLDASGIPFPWSYFLPGPMASSGTPLSMELLSAAIVGTLFSVMHIGVARNPVGALVGSA